MVSFSQHHLGDELQLHVRRALVDLAYLGVAVELLHRVLLGEAVAAEEIDRLRLEVWEVTS